MDNQSYTWTDNPTVSGVSPCNTDVLNECLMHLKYNQDKGDGFKLFDIKITDRKLVGVEAVGWMLQGGLVTMTYPDAVNQIIQEFDEGATVTYRGISCVQALNGHYVADVSKKDAIDKLFSQTGIADFYILDKTNQQFYLPRNNWFMQFSTNDSSINQFKEAGLPNIKGSIWPRFNAGTTLWNDSASGALYATGTASAEQRGDGGAVSKPAGLGFEAKRSSAVYGKSSTVQPQASTKLLYYKVGNITTDVNQILIDAKKFLEDSSNQLQNSAQEGLENLEKAKDEGVITINSASNAIKQTQISNCILEKPKNIQYELIDGVFRLKAGSVAVVPYGTEPPALEIGDDLCGYEVVDIQYENNKLFYWVKTRQDYTLTPGGKSSHRFITLRLSQAGLIDANTESLLSGETPAKESLNTRWYDIQNNVIKEYHSNNQWENSDYLSFPFAQISLNSAQTVYNDVALDLSTLGYFGKTVFVNKGIKVLVPNGFNSDGSMSNLEYENNKFRLRTITENITGRWVVGLPHPKDSEYENQDLFLIKEALFDNACDIPVTENFENGEVKYLILNNSYLGKQNNKVISRYMVPLGNVGTVINNNVINSFTPKETFSCLDFQNRSFISSMSMPGTHKVELTVGATDTTYTAPADGWFVVNAKFSSINNYLLIQSNVGVLFHSHNDTTGSMAYSIPVARKQTVFIRYSGTVESKSLTFIYANGAK